MRIESLSKGPDRAGRYWAKFDDGTTLRFYRQTVEDFGLYPGMELTEAQMTALTETAGKMSAKMRAVRIVSAASVTKVDLEQRLVHKGEDPEQAREAVTWMEELHLLDDAKVAAQVVNRCAAKGYGAARAKQALYEKRVPREYWEDALAGYPDQTEKIVDFLQVRRKDGWEERDRRRAIDALLRRGHSYSQIQAALRQLSMGEENSWEE